MDGVGRLLGLWALLAFLAGLDLLGVFLSAVLAEDCRLDPRWQCGKLVETAAWFSP
jgi:hypothetical protein